MRYNFRFDVVKNRNKWFLFSGTITILGIITLLVFGLNLGVDFRSGTTLDISVGKTIDQAFVKQALDAVPLEAETITIGGDNEDRVTLRFKDSLTQDQSDRLVAQVEKQSGTEASSEENTVSPDLAKELAGKAVYAVLIACIFIFIYVSIRFDWRFAVGSIVALLHDAFIVISLFSILRLEVNLPFIAAVLTIIGYSINDTIVIFDRIRANMRFAKVKSIADLAKIVNESVWETMTRSINTVVTVLIAALILFLFGSIAIKLFSLAMLFGLVAGCYSSIFIASTVWYLLKAEDLKKPALAATATPANE